MKFILILMSFLQVSHTYAESRVCKTNADFDLLVRSLNLYYLDSGVYPTQVQSLEALVSETSNGVKSLHFPKGGYIGKVPLDPDGEDYYFEVIESKIGHVVVVWSDSNPGLFDNKKCKSELVSITRKKA
ncbi:hypothetical protein A9Q99_14515 [Gammaproteobacteria bacterium 45_16_T64]|nr:hypothetical protein A9Q99_14515 [Gammaproteobacteria bacterium 45_16_T64]